MKIGIDLLGGDKKLDIILAVNEYIETTNNKVFAFTTKENKHNNKIDKRVEIVICKDSISSHDDPALAVRKKKESTMVIGSTYLKNGKIDAFISAGNTGALIACGIFVVKRIKGVAKPALPGLLPKLNSKTPLMLLDLGANIEPTVSNMKEYAILSIEYMREVYNIKNPSIGLVNIGEEEEKGTDFYKEIHKKFKNDKKINFHGNIEPRDVFTTKVDVLIMDGWTGNILLKTIEGTVEFLETNLKKMFLKNIFSKLSALVIKKDFKKFKSELDYKELGATPILGVDGLLLKCHGSSDKKAYVNALKKAEFYNENQLIEKLKKSLNA